jgi:ribosome assembly protein YihI (activator of Der GTPase)
LTVKIIYNGQLIDNAIVVASITSNSTSTYSLAKPQDITKVTVTSEQRKALKDSILNGEFANAELSTATKNKLNRINGYLDQLTLLYDANSF